MTRPSRPRAFAGLASLLLALLPAAPRAETDASVWLTSDPLKGRVVFEEKHCIKCHSISGSGGQIGPDLAGASFSGSFLDLSSILWNHIPDMLVEYKARNLVWPLFTDESVLHLVSYLYYLRYLGSPGSVTRGKELLRTKGCLNCHRVGAEAGGTGGPRLDALKKFVSPLYLVQAIWNHEPRMEKMMREKGVRRPGFDGQEIADLSAYIRKVSQLSTEEKIYLSPGNPKDGREVFAKKGCASCHAPDRKGKAPALEAAAFGKSAADIAGMMWNHGDVMWSSMKEQKIDWPMFDGKEMADLIAYIYFLRFIEPAGDAAKGEAAFGRKQCLSCHAVAGAGGTKGPDLSKSPAAGSELSMLRAMINHAENMSEVVLEAGRTWPLLTGAEMRDIFAYVRKSAEVGKGASGE